MPDWLDFIWITVGVLVICGYGYKWVHDAIDWWNE